EFPYAVRMIKLLILIMSSDSSQQNKSELEALTWSLAQSYEELALLHRMSDSMQVTRRPADFFARLAPEILEVVEAEKLLIFWRRDDLLDIDLPMLSSAGELSLARTHLEVIWDRTAAISHEAGGVLIDGNVDRPYAYSWPAPIRNIVSVPVYRDRRLMGAVAAVNKLNKPDFDSLDTKLLLSVANQIAVFLENFRLYRDLHELFLGSLRALTSSVDAKDAYTCGHSERVALIARHLAEQLKLDSALLNNIYLAGLLHDVGKIGIDEAVLCKPGRLTDDEFAQIKKHPQIGADILRPIKQMDHITRAVLAHHERFDGCGYPTGLSGRNIPLSGRVVMLADSFDAMISQRAYRPALPVSAALAEIRRFSGTQFDPALADAFLASDVPSLVVELGTITDHPGHYSDGKNPLESLYLPVLN
ncbi:MAG: HD domain-containing protein, partial [Sedimentisphaerales bacterium]|nr:HD domain-containing protein [Sedimentisphaerales bacterium]